MILSTFQNRPGTPSLCIKYPVSPPVSSLSLCRFSGAHAGNKHVNHSPAFPRILTRLHRNLHPLHKRHDQIVYLLTSPQLIGIQIQYLERNISGEACDAVVADVLYTPSENGLKCKGVAVAECSAKGRAVAQGCEERQSMSACVAVLR